jgi:hypothetical protein
MNRLFVMIVLPILFASCAKVNHGEQIMAVEEGLVSDLKAIEGKRIYFGHQSVGKNIVDGIRDLKASCKDSSFNLVRYDSGFVTGNSFFAQSKIGQNGNPETKCDAFASNITALESGAPLDFALMKFCFVDFAPQTDVRGVFERYRVTIETLKARYPHTTFVHVTAPLQRRGQWWKRTAKAILGREDYIDTAILKANQYNALVREYYKDEPIFDLAGVESTYPDGRREMFETKGESGFLLIGDYTSDGGHLNEMSRKIAARELIRTLARVAKASAGIATH